MTRWLKRKSTKRAHVIDVFPIEFDQCYVTRCGRVWWTQQVTVLTTDPPKNERCRVCDGVEGEVG